MCQLVIDNAVFGVVGFRVNTWVSIIMIVDRYFPKGIFCKSVHKIDVVDKSGPIKKNVIAN